MMLAIDGQCLAPAPHQQSLRFGRGATSVASVWTEVGSDPEGKIEVTFVIGAGAKLPIIMLTYSRSATIQVFQVAPDNLSDPHPSMVLVQIAKALRKLPNFHLNSFCSMTLTPCAL
jgi:hypothetical protein